MGVGMFFLPAFNNQHAVFAIGVFRLVPLRFLIADETVFVIPFGRVRTAVFVEFVVPDEFIIGIIRFFHDSLRFFDAVTMEGVKLGVEGVDNKAALARMLNRGGMFMEESKGVCYWYGAAGVFLSFFIRGG